MNLLFEGVSVAVTTPFKNGEVDYENFEAHLHYLLENDAQSFVVSGTTGEGSTLTLDEKYRLFEIAVNVADGNVPVIAGTGTNNTRETIEVSLEAKKRGVDALLIITPYYNKTTQEGAVAHFTEIADAVDLPIILYDVPARTGMTLLPETVAEAAKHPNIIGLKDATGSIPHLTRMLNLVDETFAFYSGNDDTALAFYATGGHGIISVAANALPKEHQRLYELSKSNPLEAIQLNNQLFAFTEDLEKGLNPLPIKAITSHLGFGNYEVRLPLVTLPDAQVKELTTSFDKIKERLSGQ